MANYKPGNVVKIKGRPGTWSVWSEAPTAGHYWLTAADDFSRDTSERYVDHHGNDLTPARPFVTKK
jgi:uncharacterized protein YbdZ (MbtH family)